MNARNDTPLQSLYLNYVMQAGKAWAIVFVGVFVFGLAGYGVVVWAAGMSAQPLLAGVVMLPIAFVVAGVYLWRTYGEVFGL